LWGRGKEVVLCRHDKETLNIEAPKRVAGVLVYPRKDNTTFCSSKHVLASSPISGTKERGGEGSAGEEERITE
jgi:hypothetical protein